MTETRTHDELKLAYAAQLLKHVDPFKAAFATTADVGLALQIAKAFPADPAVLEEQERILNSGDSRSFLASKEIQAKDIYTIATDTQQTVEDRLKAHRLYAEVMGHIEKPTPGVTNNILNQGVMVIRDAGTDEDWQEKAVKQQRTLLGHVN